MCTMLPPAFAPIPTDPDAIDERLSAWQYVREFGSGQDYLAFVEQQLRRLATPAALRLADALKARNHPHWIEAQLTVWYNSPVMGSCRPGYELDHEAERLALDPNLGTDELNEILDNAPERLPNWNSYCNNHS
ncbi:MAG: hypothetical protein HGA45_41590 [Chloroflexales bacterium]|nr:hypothetical protein [Chloroflexales bacterium]